MEEICHSKEECSFTWTRWPIKGYINNKLDAVFVSHSYTDHAANVDFFRKGLAVRFMYMGMESEI